MKVSRNYRLNDNEYNELLEENYKLREKIQELENTIYFMENGRP